MNKTDLIKEIGLSPSTLSRLSKNKHVSMQTLGQLCEYFSCDIGDIMEYKKQENNLTGTFVLNRDEAIHRWFPYMEGYSKDFVENEINDLHGVNSVYDPFGGSGTTMTVSSRRGLDSYYSEVNPAMAYIANTKINIVKDIIDQDKDSLLLEYIEQYDDYKNEFDYSYNDELVIGGFEKYYTNLNLHKILNYKKFYGTISDSDILAIFKVAMASVAVKSSKMIRRGDLRYANEKELDKVNKDFEIEVINKLYEMHSDIVVIKDEPHTYTTKLAEDCRDITESGVVDAIITSPPYLNGTNYFRNTKLELKLLGFIDKEKELSHFHSKGIIAGINNVKKSNVSSIILEEVEDVVKDLEKVSYDARIPPMVSNYFLGMNEALNKMSEILNADGKLILDIGDSQFAGVHVKTHDILEVLAENNGFIKYDETILRERRSKSGFKLTQRILRFKKV